MDLTTMKNIFIDFRNKRVQIPMIRHKAKTKIPLLQGN